MTYVKPDIVKKYLDNTTTSNANLSVLDSKVGKPVVSCYFNAQYLDTAMQSKLNRNFTVLKTDNIVTSSMYSPKPVVAEKSVTESGYLK